MEMETETETASSRRRVSPGKSPVVTVAVRASSERRQNALVGQLEHHRNRRLSRNALISDIEARKKRRRMSLIRGDHAHGDSDGAEDELQDQQHHPGAWRQPFSVASNQQLQQHRNLDGMNGGLITDVGLSNCHLVLYSGEITLGSPPNLQRFRVDFDTAGSDVWVPSKLCDGTCLKQHPNWNLYDPSKSSTHELASTDLGRNEFALEYQDGEAIKGEHAKDTLRLGDDDVRIPHQVFAHVTHIKDFATCDEEEGILGLANAMTTTHGFHSVLGNILHQSQQKNNHLLQHNIFGMYLRADIDDYDGITTKNNEKPKQSSELTLGGVNQDHYLGCLKWYDLLERENDGSRNYDNYWAVTLDDVKVGGATLTKDDSSSSPNSDELVAVLDSGSSYIVGPQAPVARLVQLNKAKCFRMEVNSNGSNPKEIDCNDAGGFDGAVLNNCEDPFFSVEFIIGGDTYVLEKEDLMVHLETMFGTVCILRIVASQGMKGWILGDAFLNKYYTAFDFENQKLGLALSAESADDRCERDLDMDVTHFWTSIYSDEDDYDDDGFQDTNDVANGSQETDDNDDVDQPQEEVDDEDNEDTQTDGNNDVDEQEQSDNDGTNSDEEHELPPLDSVSLDDDFFVEGDDANEGGEDNEDTFELPPLPPQDDSGNEDPNTNTHGATDGEVDSWVDEVIEKADEMQDPIDQSEQTDDGSGDSVADDFSIAQFPEQEYPPTLSPFDEPTPNPTVAPPVHVPSHYEAPKEEQLPDLAGETGTEVTSQLSNTSFLSFGGIAGMIAATFLILAIVAFMIRRRQKPSKKQQQQMFEKTYNKAERKMVDEHRNLNYRDHSSSRFQDALEDIHYVEEFHDEEGGIGRSGSGSPNKSGNEDQPENEFVLDSNILQRMN